MKGKTLINDNWSKKIKSFCFKSWFRQNWQVLLFLTLPALIIYTTSLNNDFVSDDTYSLLNNTDLNSPQYFIKAAPAFLQGLIYFLINKFFGLRPELFRSLNIIFHLGNIFLVYFLINLLINSRVAALLL